MYKILLVDDDRMIRFGYKRFKKWSEFGFAIAGEAENGYEALQKIENEDFDLAFVDLKMPKIDGLGFLSALKEKNQALCVIIVSGYSDFQHARQGFKLGAFDYLIKPVAEENLCALLQSAKEHLDDLQEQNKLRSKTQTDLAQSLMLPYQSADEDQLLSAILHSPDEAGALAEKTVQKIVKFYEHDCFKIATLLGSSHKSLVKRLLQETPYLFEICKFETFPEGFYAGTDEATVVAWYIQSLVGLAEFLNRFQLNQTDSVIRLFCEYLLSHLEKESSMEALAKEIGYSSKYISKVFKEKTGESCICYITRLKMQHAGNLVLSGKYKNYEISDMLGYKSPDYFCSLFKKHFGVTPSKFKTHSKPVHL